MVLLRHEHMLGDAVVLLVFSMSQCTLLKPKGMCANPKVQALQEVLAAHESVGDMDANCCQRTARVRMRMCAYTTLAIFHSQASRLVS